MLLHRRQGIVTTGGKGGEPSHPRAFHRVNCNFAFLFMRSLKRFALSGSLWNFGSKGTF